MKKYHLLIIGLTLPTIASEMPPIIPAGPIDYDQINGTASAPATTVPAAATSTAAGATYADPVTPGSSSEKCFELGINLYTSNYQVRGMGVTDEMSGHGWSGVSASYTLPNQNLFEQGLYAKFSGGFGIIWDAANALGDTPKFDLGAAIGKEIFPNLKLEAGYAMHRGGLEGFMARFPGGEPHRFTQDISLTLTFNDQQRGFFGHATWGYGFQGLTGHFFDLEAGYRLTDVVRHSLANADLELSAGVAPSVGYWGAGVEGIDAYRIKAALIPYSHNGKLGRDAAWQVKPWVQFSWSGDNAGKIDRACGTGPIDHFQVTVGIEGGYSF